MASLTVINGPDRGRRFELIDAKPVIGRDARASIRLHDNEISRSHAEIHREENACVLVDLKSSNGTYVNGQRVDTQPLRRGDRIRIGQTEMLFTDGRGEGQEHDLAGKIDMVGRQQSADSSAIYRAIKHSEGSQYLLHAEKTGSIWLKEALANLAVMYETSQAVSRIDDIDQLLDHIMDLVFKSIRADRGCVVLTDPETRLLRPTSVRYAAGVDSEEKITLSRTIVEWVLRKQEGVIVIDAAKDQRFSSAQSIAQLGIREAICVPLRGRHDTLGVMYVDTKTERKHFLATGQPAKFTDDHLKLMIAIAHQAGLAIEDNRFHEAMVQAERLAAIGQTIATVSHHIKNILQGVRSGNDLVEMGLADNNQTLLRHGWGVVRKNQERIYNLVMDMLSFSKEREPDLQPTELNGIVVEVVEMMAGRAKEIGAALETILSPAMPKAMADPEGIHRALLNLVTNALDAVEGRPSPRVIVESLVDRAGAKFEINVVDNGSGISKQNLDRIFQVFISTKGARGTGLGLPVTKKILLEHEGDVLAASIEGQGSRFTLQLPFRELPAAEEKAIRGFPPPDQTHHE